MKRFLPPRIMITLTIALLMAFSLSAKGLEPFRFAVVTDVHINKTHPNPLQDLRLSVQQINATDSIDFVLVTGDIADGGKTAQTLVYSGRQPRPELERERLYGLRPHIRIRALPLRTQRLPVPWFPHRPDDAHGPWPRSPRGYRVGKGAVKAERA